MDPISIAMAVISTIIQDTPEAIALFNQAKAVALGQANPDFQALLTAMAAAHTKVQAA